MSMPNYSLYPDGNEGDADRRFVVQSAGQAIALGHVEGGGTGLAIKPGPGNKA